MAIAKCISAVVIRTIVCGRCGYQLGVEEEVAGVQRLLIGGILVQSAHGACGNCGKEFHWSLSEKKLEELIQLVKQISDI